MGGNGHSSPAVGALARRLARTGVGLLRNRTELFATEWQEEKVRLTDLLIRTLCVVFLGLMGVVLITGIVIFAIPPDYRLYVAGGLAILFLLGAAGLWISLRTLLKREPFADSIDQLKKDGVWLESLK